MSFSSFIPLLCLFLFFLPTHSLYVLCSWPTLIRNMHLMPLYLEMWDLYSMDSINQLCGNSKCSLLRTALLYMSVTAVIHTHTRTLCLSWQCLEQSLPVLLAVVFPDECFFVSCVPLYTPCQQKPKVDSPSHPHHTGHPSIHPPIHLSIYLGMLSTLPHSAAVCVAMHQKKKGTFDHLPQLLLF